MQRTRGGRRIGRYLAALAGTAVIAAGLVVPATAASAGIISIGVAGIDLTSVLGGPGSFGWSTSRATPGRTTQVAKAIGATSTAATRLDGTGGGGALIHTGGVPAPGPPPAQNLN